MTRILLFSTLILSFISCEKKSDPIYHPGDLTRGVYVAIGGSNSSGYSDDALYNEAQKNSVAELISQQLNIVGFEKINSPFTNDLSVGSNLGGDSKLILGYKTDCNGESSLSPIRQSSSGDATIFNNMYSSLAPFSNISIPNTTCLDAVLGGLGNPANGFHNPYFSRCASSTDASIISDAVAMNPTFYTIYFGENEVLEFASSGGVADLTQPNGPSGIGFDGTMDDIISQLSANGANGAIANISDVTSFPFFTTIPWNGLNITQEQANDLNQVFNPLGITFSEGDNPFTVEDTSTAYNVRLLEEGELILLTVPLDSIKCYGMGTIHPIPQEYVLSLDEIDNLQNHIDQYNTIIDDLAVTYNLALVDLHQFYQDLSSGILYNGINISSDFVSGGAFSLDGRTMTPLGNALIANLFITSINSKFIAAIPKLDVGDFRGNLFP